MASLSGLRRNGGVLQRSDYTQAEVQVLTHFKVAFLDIESSYLEQKIYAHTNRTGPGSKGGDRDGEQGGGGSGGGGADNGSGGADDGGVTGRHVAALRALDAVAKARDPWFSIAATDQERCQALRSLVLGWHQASLEQHRASLTIAPKVLSSLPIFETYSRTLVSPSDAYLLPDINKSDMHAAATSNSM